ncbi:hypothetical protein D0Z08_19575 [Nocardioides immobilis]|uniref:Uncharacterized protein n=1 Tax=Nocardioides immobilis TaxID=2049295 RepID=A0A417XYJ0_9ACTN|nr:hypothetical protein [Nocardioides immobilis]RHW25429.1 hypothetical protein D0Z08_19575 [Nocardioides immobilis]
MPTWTPEPPVVPLHDSTPRPLRAPTGSLARGPLRGVVVEARRTSAGAAFGARPLMWTVVTLAVVALAVTWEENAVAVATSLVGCLCPFLVLIGFGMMGRHLIPGASSLGGGFGRGFGGRGWWRRDPVAWDVLVDTGAGVAAGRIAANTPLQGGERITVRGPRVGSVKHAWLVRVSAPYRRTRLGRGLIRAGIVTAFGLLAILDLLA